MAAKTDPETTADVDGQADDTKTGDGKTRSIDARFAAIEAEQQKQGGILEQILDRLPGGSGSDDDAEDDDASEPTQRHNIGAQVRRGIAAAEQRRKTEEREAGFDTWRKGVDEQLEKLRPEQAPRPTLNRWQRALFGGHD